MAERRMFSRTLTGSARFLKMSGEARLLYYDLGMEADDDGFAEGFVRIRVTGTREEHLQELAKAGFLDILNDDLVVHITDWDRNNQIRRDRYHRSVYLDLFPQYDTAPQDDNQPETTAQPVDNQMTTTAQPTDNQMATNPQPSDNHLSDTRLTEVRSGKDRVEEVSIDQSVIGQNSLPAPAQEAGRQLYFEIARELCDEGLMVSDVIHFWKYYNENHITIPWRKAYRQWADTQHCRSA